MAKKRLLVDMDGTLARFHDQNMYLERMYEKDFFRELEPFENMVKAVRDIVLNHPEVEVFIVSAKVIGEPPYCVAEKNAWLDRFLPEIDQDHRIFTDMGRSKAEYMPGGVTKDDFLLDDYNKGLNLFLGDGGCAIKVMNNINMRGLGAYGGDKGHMWTGPMVTTEARASVIVGDLLECMGLSRDKAAEASELNIQSLSDNDWCKKARSGFFYTEHTNDLVQVGLNQTCIPQYCASFGDAIKYLDASRSNNERVANAYRGHLVRSENQECLVLSGWQVEAICTNLGLNKDEFKESKAVSRQLFKQIQKELSDGLKPIFGRIDYLDQNGCIEKSSVFRDPNEMYKSIELATSGPYQHDINIDWFIKPKREDLLPQYRGPEPEPWTLCDQDTLQHSKALDPFGVDPIYEMCQLMKLPTGYVVCHGVVDADLPQQLLEDYLHLYGYDDLDDFVRQNTASSEFIYHDDGTIDRENSPSWYVDYSYVAEMIFETNFMEFMDSHEVLTWDEAVNRIADITGVEYIRDLDEPGRVPARNFDGMLQDATNRSQNTFSGPQSPKDRF